MQAIEMKTHLEALEAERALASVEGLEMDPAYMEDLHEEIVTMRQAYVGAAVIEIAILRAELWGPPAG